MFQNVGLNMILAAATDSCKDWLVFVSDMDLLTFYLPYKLVLDRSIRLKRLDMMYEQMKDSMDCSRWFHARENNENKNLPLSS